MADNDVLVITGGAGGMGLACACALADRGQLLLVDVDEGQLEKARSMLSARGANVDTLLCDVTSPADVAGVADRVSASGRFRCLVHTVGVSPEMADARTVIEVDLVGSVRVTDAVFPLVESGTSCSARSPATATWTRPSRSCSVIPWPMGYSRRLSGLSANRWTAQRLTCWPSAG